MGDLTPFQNQVLDAAERVEAERKKEKREEMRKNSGAGKTRNSRASSGSPNKSDMGQEETVRYVNKELNPDHEAHESD